MPSSTSSSNDRLPQTHAVTSFIGTVLLFALFMGGYELIARSQGFTPTINDTMANWAAHREKVEDQPEAITFVGTSRMTAAIDIPAVRKRYPSRVVEQLAIDATQPAAVIRDLTSDPSVSGVIICSISPVAFKPDSLWSQQPWVGYYQHRWSISERISYEVGDLLDRVMVTRQPSWGAHQHHLHSGQNTIPAHSVTPIRDQGPHAVPGLQQDRCPGIAPIHRQ